MDAVIANAAMIAMPFFICAFLVVIIFSPSLSEILRWCP